MADFSAQSDGPKSNPNSQPTRDQVDAIIDAIRKRASVIRVTGVTEGVGERIDSELLHVPQDHAGLLAQWYTWLVRTKADTEFRCLIRKLLELLSKYGHGREFLSKYGKRIHLPEGLKERHDAAEELNDYADALAVWQDETYGATKAPTAAVEDHGRKHPWGGDDPEAPLSPAKIADRLGIPSDDSQREALRKRLESWRKANLDGGWIETRDPKPREPRYLYPIGKVWSIVEDMKHSG
jgi:hypothetical protein